MHCAFYFVCIVMEDDKATIEAGDEAARMRAHRIVAIALWERIKALWEAQKRNEAKAA